MSDAQSSRDWWLASDGRWYPPEAKPGPLPPPDPPPPPIPTYVPAAWPPVGVNLYSDEPRPPGRVLGGWLQGLCWASVALFAAVSVACIVTAVRFQAYWTGSGRRARALALTRWADAEDATGGVFTLAITVWLTALVLMMVWMNKAHFASSRLWPGPRSWTSGWAVGGWFIPLANLVIPKLVLLEIERLATSVDEDGNLDGRWRARSGSAVGWLFWVAVVVALIAAFIGICLVPDMNDGRTQTDADLYVAAFIVFAGANLMAAFGAMFGALHFRTLGRSLSTGADTKIAAVNAFGGAWAHA